MSVYEGTELLDALEHADNYNQHLTDLVRDAANGSTLVDFGAGVGTFAKRLRISGFEVICIEPDLAQRNRLLDLGFRALETIEALPDDSAAFIFSLNVFEHIEDHRAIAQLLHRKLSKGARLLVYVPAFKCLWSALDDNVGHYRRYTRTSLRTLLEEQGFTVERLRYADSLGFLAALVFKLTRRDMGALNQRSIRLYDRLLFPISALADRVFSALFGKNVYAVARK